MLKALTLTQSNSLQRRLSVPEQDSSTTPKKPRNIPPIMREHMGRWKSVSMLVDGMTTRQHPLYNTWLGMRKRCYRPENDNYYLYGARGITVCERWRNSFANFVADMGPRPTPTHTVDRINANGNYEPSNCRWATPEEQQKNQRPPKRKLTNLLPNGWTRMAKNAGLNHQVVMNRVVKFGWTLQRALSTPAEKMWDGSKARTYPSKQKAK